MTGAALPAPPVPPDADLRHFATMPLHVQRLRDSELATQPDAEVRWANLMSWCAAWHQRPAGSLPDDDTFLCRLLGYGRELRFWRRLRAKGALRGWYLAADGRLYHPTIAEMVVATLRTVQRRADLASPDWPPLRAAVFERDDYTCRYCGKRGTPLECDHVTPVSKGGKTDESNLVTACRSCNRSKGAKTLEEWLS
jgi:hypothetical protein